MKKSGLPPIAWALGGLLAIGAMIISFGQQDRIAKPETDSFSPSGTSAFVQLLKQRGFDVAVDQTVNPKLRANDVVVAIPVVSEQTAAMADLEAETPFHKFFWGGVSRGGSAIILPIPRNFQTASITAQDHPGGPVLDGVSERSFQVSSSELGVNPFDEPDYLEDSTGIDLWSQDKNPFVRAYRVGKGTLLVAKNALGITNRFIDKGDNAKAFISLLSILVKPGQRIVFLEASFGNIHESSLMETIGPWANAIWQQLLFLGVVIVFTLGIRFGIPEESRRSQRGSRELFDGVSDIFSRARTTDLALSTAFERASADLRMVLKLPNDVQREDRDRLIPANLKNALTRVEMAKDMKSVPQDQALDLIKRLNEELELFVGPHRAKLRSLAKLKK